MTKISLYLRDYDWISGELEPEDLWEDPPEQITAKAVAERIGTLSARITVIEPNKHYTQEESLFPELRPDQVNVTFAGI